MDRRGEASEERAYRSTVIDLRIAREQGDVSHWCRLVFRQGLHRHSVKVVRIHLVDGIMHRRVVVFCQESATHGSG